MSFVDVVDVLSHVQNLILVGDDSTDDLLGCAKVGEGVNLCFKSHPHRWFRIEISDVTEKIQRALEKTA